MAALAAVALVTRRSALLKVICAAFTTALLAGLMVFLGGVAVLTGMTGQRAFACEPSGVDASTVVHGKSAGLEIRAAGQLLYVLNPRQASVARTYIAVGKQLAVPRSGFIIAIMMALQESSLRMLANPAVPESLNFPNDGIGRDHDSIGSAQQRPAPGWGTVPELMDASYNARAFYGGSTGPNRGSPRGLLDIRGWEAMDKGLAAQAVQVSAFPELYARWEPTATAIVSALETDTRPASCSSTPPGTQLVGSTRNLSQLRQDILRFTQEGLGGRYVWGGTAFKAWDCSGYVQWIYRQVGIELPRVEQWRVGIRTESPQPGDLVVQNPQGPYNWGHVGIYAGDGMMWSALNPSVGTLLHPVSWNPGAAYFDLLSR
ncbi:C40 family peptidase [Arthrobacter nitrophenolicus]|uniref:CHAP domain-containing protein n=1 Tax=Arthrobacter nitrophenolicus TaxID=683150 RepID=A0A4R5XR42_9MICC|nr:C40 family peptidase [Arthrobacter nitrophenolicus]TDL34053.1 CHAP domain-containing protein [Arthrobacter nitrophenolicus]